MKHFTPGSHVWVFLRLTNGSRVKKPAIYLRPTARGHRYAPADGPASGEERLIGDEFIELRSDAFSSLSFSPPSL